jgi:internalin A
MSFSDATAIAKARIGEELNQLTGFLDLSGLGLNAFPKELSRLTALQTLNCSDTQVSDLSPLSGLTALRTLDCSSTQVSDLSPLSRLTALQALYCFSTQVSDLSPLSRLTVLQTLYCFSTQVSDLSPLSRLTALQTLYCSSTQVSDLSPLSRLTALQSLDCSSTQVSDLSPLSRLTALQTLYCTFTQVSDLSPLSRLTALQSLDCSSTQVSDLSPLSGLTALQTLYCSNTQVSDLSPLSGLTALQTLNCSNTQVSDLSPLSRLTTFQSLNCSRCRLRALPSFIRDNLRLTLFAFEAHVPGVPHGILSRSSGHDCRARVQAHFADMSEAAANLTDVKLMLLGNGGVGKTQIVRWLSGEKFDTNWDSTHGIRIARQPQAGNIAARLHLQMWDFGGQDIYHGTHAMFLRGPAILMSVWAKDRENRDAYDQEGLTFRNHPLAYWLDVVTHQASPDNPVLIVQNKCDRKEDEKRSDTQATLDTLKYSAELHISPKPPGRGLAALEETLQDAIFWLRNSERQGLPQIGAGRLRVQRRLEAMRDADAALPREQRHHSLLDRKDFDSICAEEGGISSPAMLLDYLDANGTVFYRPGMFSDRIVLDQGWALDAIYAVFDRKRVYRVLLQDGGRFSRAKLGLMVWRDLKDDEQKLLLSMMVSCGMCFPHRHLGGRDDDNAEYIAPDLLPPWEAVAPQLAPLWAEDRPGEVATFQYDLLHSGLMRSIMGEIGGLAGVNALYWRGGLCAFDAGTRSRLLIEEEMTGDWKGAVRVRTQDGQSAVLQQMIVEVVERAQSRLGLRPVIVERSTPPIELPETTKLSPQQEKPAMPEWYVSYAWNDDRTPEGHTREVIVDRLCAAASAQGHRILRDKDALTVGDSISAFMQRIGAGDRVFVIMSDKYLRSPYCMFELSEVWRTSRQEGKAFLERVRIYALPNTTIFDPNDWADWAIHWKKEHDALEKRALEHGLAILGDLGNRRLTQMRNFYHQVSDILGTLADIVQPRTFAELERYGFNDLPVSPVP